MSQLHVYITPFDDNGDYASEVEVTEDVDFSSLSSLKNSLDNNEFDIGIFRTSNVKLKLINTDGKYSEADSIRSIFKFKRIDSLVRITWEPGDYKLVAGFFEAGCAVVSEEVEVFKGLLNDAPSKMNAARQDIQFTVLGIEDIFNRVEVPIASISNGDSFETIFLTLLNQTAITDLLTVSAGNIDAGINETIDDKSDLENKTVLQALKSLLLPSNSVLYIENDTVFIQPRDPAPTVSQTFYGQGSKNGLENILGLTDITDGQNRIFNYLTWRDTTELQQSASSILRYGIRSKELSLSLIDDASMTKINNILASIRDEFAEPRQELNMEVPLNPDTLGLGLLDKVSIDYSTITLESDEGTVPIYDTGLIYDTGVIYPSEIGTLQILLNDEFKILERKVNLKDETIDFRLRKV